MSNPLASFSLKGVRKSPTLLLSLLSSSSFLQLPSTSIQHCLSYRHPMLRHPPRHGSLSTRPFVCLRCLFALSPRPLQTLQLPHIKSASTYGESATTRYRVAKSLNTQSRSMETNSLDLSRPQPPIHPLDLSQPGSTKPGEVIPQRLSKTIQPKPSKDVLQKPSKRMHRMSLRRVLPNPSKTISLKSTPKDISARATSKDISPKPSQKVSQKILKKALPKQKHSEPVSQQASGAKLVELPKEILIKQGRKLTKAARRLRKRADKLASSEKEVSDWSITPIEQNRKRQPITKTEPSKPLVRRAGSVDPGDSLKARTLIRSKSKDLGRRQFLKITRRSSKLGIRRLLSERKGVSSLHASARIVRRTRLAEKLNHLSDDGFITIRKLESESPEQYSDRSPQDLGQSLESALKLEEQSAHHGANRIHAHSLVLDGMYVSSCLISSAKTLYSY